jgi:L,D-transpeptidase ErfK/SrfK
MKPSLKRSATYILCCLCLYATIASFAAPAVAGVREEAESAVSALRNNASSQKYPDDMKSLDLVFEVAQRYFSGNDKETADKFFLLALQKSQIIELMLKMTVVTDAPTAPDAKLSAEATIEELPAEPDSSRLVGLKGTYTVVKGDSIRLVAAKLGVAQQHLRAINSLDAKATLKIGQKLAYDNRKIIPQMVKNGIIINIPDRTLYYFQQGALVTSLPVALGSATKNEKYVWQTPVGKFRITAKMKDPTWTVPPSIQSEMEEQGKEVITTLPPGPQNPLGKYAIKTSIPGILIHSTTKPWSIYSFSSHGCIRLSPDQMEDFFPQIKVNTRGEIIYKPVKLAVTESGRVFLEVHRDVYNTNTNLVVEAKQMIEKQKLTELVDWEKFNSALKRKSGTAEDISL